MNFAIIFYILGSVIKIEGILMLFPAAVAGIYREMSGMWFLLCAAVCIVTGFLMSRKRPENCAFYAKEGFIIISLSWIVLSLIGALPFTLSGEIPFYIDALFEIISGFTTTGSSILTDVEALDHCMLFWRSFSHWIGGMGVLVFVLAILPLAGAQNMYLMRTESPGPTFGKLVPKLQQSALFLYTIYFVMSGIELLFLLAGRMPVFDAVCTVFGTAGTGGFGIRNTSIADYSPYLQAVITVFMFLFGVNFNFYFLIIIRRVKDAFRMEEVRWYFLIFSAAVLAIAVNLTSLSGHFISNLHHAAFQVSSVMTTTGFATADFNQWPVFSKTILVLTMFIGACAGSTGGGIKVSRSIIYIKSTARELSMLIHPRSVKVLKTDGKAIDDGVIRSAGAFLMCYVLVFAVSVLLVSLDGMDPSTTFTAVAATINNIGPGLEQVGPTANFSIFTPFSKLVLMFDMLAGRLEIFPMLLLFSPRTWKRH